MNDEAGTRRGRARCTICRHERVAEIEGSMAAGLGKRQVARRYGVSEDAVFRHWHNHTSEVHKVALRTHYLAPGIDLKELVEAEGSGLLRRLASHRVKLQLQFDGAFEDGDRTAVARLSGQILACEELVAKATGELAKHTKKGGIVHVVTSAEYLELRGRLLEVLRRFPDAKAAVLEAFRRTEAKAEAEMTPAMIESQAVEVSHESIR